MNSDNINSNLSVSSADEGLKKIAIITEIRTTLQEVRDLPTLPSIAFEVLKIAGKPNANVNDMVRVMEVDVALTGKILRTANSAYYGVPRKIDSLRMALVVIGMDEISNLVTTASILKAFPAQTGSDDWDARHFWFHNAAVAELTIGLVDLLNLPKPTGAYVAGILHDVGHLMLHQYFNKYWKECQQFANSNGMPNFRAEQQLLGVDHGHVGAWLIQRWNLPDEISQAVAQHHIRPADSPQYGLCALIDFADRLFHRMFNRPAEKVVEELRDDDEWREWIGSRASTTEVMVKELYARMDRATRLLEIMK